MYVCLCVCVRIRVHVSVPVCGRAWSGGERGERGDRKRLLRITTAFVCSVLQCVAVCYSVVQRGAAWCSVVQYVAVCCSALQCVAARCSVSQRVALRQQQSACEGCGVCVCT